MLVNFVNLFKEAPFDLIECSLLFFCPLQFDLSPAYQFLRTACVVYSVLVFKIQGS